MRKVQWHIIDDCSNYAVSNTGLVKNIRKNKILELSLDKNGYKVCGLYSDHNKYIPMKVHRLVAKYFVPNPNNYKIVNHIDEDKSNANYTNLEWVTHQQNMDHGTRNERISESLSMPVAEYNLNGELIRIWKSPKFVSKVYPVSTRAVQLAAKETSYNKTCYGRQWRYFNKLSNRPLRDIKAANGRCLNYNANANHDVEIPKEYLFLYEDKRHFARYIDMLDNVIGNPALSQEQFESLNKIKRFFEINSSKH